MGGQGNDLHSSTLVITFTFDRCLYVQACGNLRV
jgi:hypothetical protein